MYQLGRFDSDKFFVEVILFLIPPLQPEPRSKKLNKMK
jgi:hypothetical protein